MVRQILLGSALLVAVAFVGCGQGGGQSALPDQAEPAVKMVDPESVQAHHMAISGMNCSGCASRIQFELEKMPGITSATVTFASEENSTADVAFDSSITDVQAIEAKIISLKKYQILAADTASQPAASTSGSSE